MPNIQFKKTMTKQTVSREEFDFTSFMRHYVVALRRFIAPLLIFCFTVACGVFAYCKLSYTPKYQCTVTFLASPLTPIGNSEGTPIYSYKSTEGLGTQISVSFPQIFQTGILRDIVSDELGGYIDGEVYANSSPATNYFELTVISGTPQSAKDIADSLLRNYPRVIENILGDIKAEVKIPAKLPTEPYNKSEYITWVFMSFVGSLAVGLILICVYVVRRKTVCSKNDIRYVLNQTYLCEIPLIKGKNSREHEKFKTVIRSKSFTEAMRTLKNRTIATLNDNGYRTVGFVSTSDNEGKTCVGAGFAKVLSAAGDPVVFVTFDRNKSDGDNATRKKRSPFGQKRSTVDVVRNMSFERKDGVVSGIRRFFTNTDLLLLDPDIIQEKDKLRSIIEELHKVYSYVVVDIVAGGSNSESVKFADACDAIISVVRCDYVSSEKIKATLSYLSYSNAHNLGCVLNEVTSAYISYGRYTGYGKYSKYGYSYYYRNYGYGQYGTDAGEHDNP